MTKKLAAFIIALALLVAVGIFISKFNQTKSSLPLEEVAESYSVEFNIGDPNSEIFHGAFQGFGAEWDPFFWNGSEYNSDLAEEDWQIVTQRIKDLNMGIIRMMMQLEWATSDPDLINWDWDNQQMYSVYRYLDFACQNDIDVVLTDWGWTAYTTYKGDPTDVRFARGIAEYLKEFIQRRNYTCIKYLVIGNEPDNEIEKKFGMDAYEKMYRNVHQALIDNGMRDQILLTGPDMAGTWVFMEEAVNRLHDILDVYDYHRYATYNETGNFELPGTWESLWIHLDRWRAEVNSRDPKGSNKLLLITEMGTAGGRTSWHGDIDTFEYAIHMADYGTTLLTTRNNAGIAWNMHDIFYFTRDYDMQWGMWDYKDTDWKLRPWSHSFGLLVKHAPRGSAQAPINGIPPQAPSLSPYRAAAVVRPDGRWSIFLVNRTASPVSMRVNLPSSSSHPFTVYKFDKNTYAQYPDIIAIPASSQIPATDQIDLELPAESFYVLSESDD
jgi:hypothetical protein